MDLVPVSPERRCSLWKNGFFRLTRRGRGDVPLCGTGMLHRCGDTIPGPRQGPSIVPLPRNGLASSATGGASPISPIFFSGRKRKPSRGPSRRYAAHLGGPCTVQKKSAFGVQLYPLGAKLDGRELVVRCATKSGNLLPGALYPVLRRGRCLHRPLLPRICRRGYRVGVVTARLSATSPAAAAPALQASGSEKERWSFQSLPDLAIPIRVAQDRKLQQDRTRAQRFR